jgi:hypothetical protein
MTKPRWRIFLPFGHLTVDCLVLALWLGHIQSLYRPKAEVYPSLLMPVLLFQEAGQPAWNPKFSSPPPEFLLLAAGNVPAMLVSVELRPEAAIVTFEKPWDPVWFLIHETMCFLIWFAIGVSLDSGLLRLVKTMVAYLGMRFGLAVFLEARGVAYAGGHLEVLLWSGFGVYALIVCLRWVLSKIHLTRAAS